MAYISEHTSGLSIPQYKTTSYDTEMQSKLLMLRQSKYNEALSRLSNLKSQALNITMVNQLGVEKLKQYNDDINSRLSGDLGDLSDKKVQASLASTFSKISNDTDLLQRSKLSQWYIGEQSKIDKMKMDKDPTKSGYDAVNEFVFKNWEGGYNDFVNATNVDKFNTQREGYVPFRDINQKLVNLTKLLHAEKNQTFTAKDGRILYTTTEGVSPERIRTVLTQTLTQDEISQMDILSKYRILSNSNPEDDRKLGEAYTNFASSEARNISIELKKAEALVKQYNPNLIDPKDKDKDEKIAKYTKIWQENLANIDDLSTKLKRTQAEIPTASTWAKKTKEEKKVMVRQMMYEDKVNAIATALWPKSEIQKVESDQAYWSSYKIQTQAEMFKHKMNVDKDMSNLRWAQLQLETEKAQAKAYSDALNASEKASGGTEASGSAYTAPTPIDLVGTFDKLNDETNLMLARSVNLVADPQVTDKQLEDKNWIKTNGENHYVKLWADFKQKHPDGDRVEFNTYLEKISNEGTDDPYTSVHLDALKRDKAVANSNGKEIARVNSIAFGAATAYQTYFGNKDRTNPDPSKRDASVEDYARMSGWNPSMGEMFFILPDEKGVNKRFSLKEVQSKINNPKEYKDISFSGQVGASQGLSSVATTPEYFTSNAGFVQVITAAEKLKKQKLGQLEKAVSEGMTDNAQGTLQIYGKEKGLGVIRKNLGSVNQSMRQGTEFGVSEGMIENMHLPTTIGDVGYYTFTADAIKGIKSNNKESIFQTASGEVTGENLTVNHKIKFDYINPKKYDYELIRIFNRDNEFTDAHAGHDIELTKDPISGTIGLTIKKGTTVIFERRYDPNKPVDEILSIARNGIDQTIKK